MEWSELQQKKSPLRALKAEALLKRVWEIRAGIYGVESQSRPGQYWVVHAGERTACCDCPDYVHRGVTCKHIIAVGMFIGRELTAVPEVEGEGRICNLCGKITTDLIWAGDDGWICRRCYEK